MSPEIQFPIYSIPHKKNINFTGRDRELRRLRVQGFGDGKGVSFTQAITGLGDEEMGSITSSRTTYHVPRITHHVSLHVVL